MQEVTDAQWEALQVYSRASFVRRLRKRLALRPEPVGSAARKLEDPWFSAFLDRCRAWGLTDQADVLALAEVALSLGQRRFERPEILSILDDPERGAQLKLFQVRRRALESAHA